MSTDADEDANGSASSERERGAHIPSEIRDAAMRLGEDQKGRQMFLAPYSEDLAKDAVTDSISMKADAGPGHAETPASSDADTAGPDDEGPIQRFTDIFTDLGQTNLEAIGMDGYEVAAATQVFRDEMYRNDFPLLQPRFEEKCEVCGTEFEKDVPACEVCTKERAEEMGVIDPPDDVEKIPERYWAGNLRGPSEEQKDRVNDLVREVNKEGQSFRELMKMLEDDQSRLGVSTMVVRWSYATATGDIQGLAEEGEVLFEEPVELLRGDPKRLVPVVDGDGRIGNWKWTCPVHREDAIQDHGGHCDKCGTKLREIYFAEKKHVRSSQVDKYYFQDEVISWARHYPKLHGLDGLSPMHHVWLKQAILHWMDVYGAAFYDPSSDRYPNKLMVVHTTNTDAWDRNFQQAEDEAKEDPYSNMILTNEYSPESRSTPDLQVVDLMNDELMGQDMEIRQQYKQDIRSHFGVSNMHENDTEQGGGLNNEGLQLEVTDRAISGAMKDTMDGPLDELEDLLGMSDWKFEFVPPQRKDVEETHGKIRAGMDAAKAGLEPSWEDDELHIPDGKFEAGQQGPMGGMGGLGAMMGMGQGQGPPGQGQGQGPPGEENSQPPSQQGFGPLSGGEQMGGPADLNKADFSDEEEPEGN